MNTTAILNRLHATINRYGAVGTLTNRTAATPSADGTVTSNSTTYNVTYVEIEFEGTEKDDTERLLTQRKVLIDAQQIADATAVDSFTTSDGVSYQVTKVERATVQGVLISYTLYLSGGQA